MNWIKVYNVFMSFECGCLIVGVNLASAYFTGEKICILYAILVMNQPRKTL